MVHANEYENLVRFRYDVLYTLFDGKECILSESDLGKLLRCDHYTSPYKTLDHYFTNNVWDTLSREAGSKKIASNLKSLPLRFLHHFVASIIQCKSGSFIKMTTDDIWLFEMASKGIKINLTRFIMKK